MSDNPSLTSDPAGGCSRGLKVAQDEPLDAILSPELDKMVSDGEFYVVFRLIIAPLLYSRASVRLKVLKSLNQSLTTVRLQIKL